MNRRTLIKGTVLAAWGTAALPAAAHAAGSDSARPNNPANWSPGVPGQPRSCFIRLGQSRDRTRRGPHLYYPSNHACVGITRVYRDGYDIVIESDFDGTREMCSGFGVMPDYQTAAMGLTAGPSGGGPVTRVGLFTRNGTRIRPDSTLMDLDSFNIQYVMYSKARTS